MFQRNLSEVGFENKSLFSFWKWNYKPTEMENGFITKYIEENNVATRKILELSDNKEL